MLGLSFLFLLFLFVCSFRFQLIIFLLFCKPDLMLILIAKRMLVGLRFGVPCLSTTFGDDGTAVVCSVGVLLARFSNNPSASLIVSLAAARGKNTREPSRRLAPDTEGVDEVGGGDVKPRPFCERAEGWGDGWTGGVR